MSDHIKVGAMAPRVQYATDGSRRAFPFGFPIFRDQDLEVYLDNGRLFGGYRVTGAGSSDGGTVTLDAAPAADRVLTLRRRVAVRRVTDFLQGGALRADSFNDEFDHLTAMAQQAEDDLSRALHAPRHDTPAFLELPPRAERAGRALVFDADGNAALGAVGEVVSPFGPYVAALSGAVSRSVYDKLRDQVTVKDFGARGDGFADDTPAFTAALTATKSVSVPAGTYRLTGTLVLSVGQSLTGTGDASILVCENDAIPAIEIRGDYNVVQGLRIDGGAVGIKLYGADRPCVQNLIADLSIWRAGTGVLLDGHDSPDRPTYWNALRDVLIVQPREHGVHLTRSGGGDTPNANRFDRLRVYSLAAPTTGTGIWVEHGKYNNSFIDCEVNLSTTAHSCVRVGADTDKTLFVNLYTETTGPVPNVMLEDGSRETALTNLFSASAGAAIWDFSGGQYTAVNAGFPEKNRLGLTRVRELVVERFRYDTAYIDPPAVAPPAVDPPAGGAEGTVVDIDPDSACQFISAANGPVEARLPPPGDCNGCQVTLKKVDGGPHPVIVTVSGGTGPDGRPQTLANPWEWLTVVSNGAVWYLVSGTNRAGDASFHEGVTLVEPSLLQRLVLVSAWGGETEVRLPAPSAPHAVGRELVVKKSDPSPNAVRVTAAVGTGPDGAAIALTDHHAFVGVFSNGAGWHITARG